MFEKDSSTNGHVARIGYAARITHAARIHRYEPYGYAAARSMPKTMLRAAVRAVRQLCGRTGGALVVTASREQQWKS